MFLPVSDLFVVELFVAISEVASLIKGQPLEKIKDILSKGTKNEGKPDSAAPVAGAEKKEEKKSL